MVCTFIDTLCKYTTCVMRCLRRCSRCYWSAVDCDGRATCSWSRLTALLLRRLLGVLLFTEARLMGRAVQWSPMKPESELIRLVPLKSSPTCSYRWLHCEFQNVPCEHANCTAWLQLADWFKSSSWLESKLLYDWQSVSHYVLASSTRYYFPSECYCLKFAVLYWGALSVDRSGLQFAV
jgi:hypothetical protein